MDLIVLAPCAIIATALYAASRVLRHWLRLRRAWNSGMTAEGRCLRVYTTTYGGDNGRVHTTLHHVYEFMTKDGRTIRFEEEDGPGTTIEGDFVTVHYAGGASVVATALPPRHVRQTLSTFGLLAFLGMITVFSAGFLLSYRSMDI
ncbi:hypothetical protein STRCI_003197 [Streptomyces cinnabarinus]|uniref:DUF3592 domain-containing protein n=1 Tax=Streptomyces cinnabarinus TaxID=67287 RepID=A0ABY7KE72_9ACTN|nr:hypothetical protein [Streptomyces cinnabarinus]WAZ21985.1 hypothetical protein STRCI_003197 [Streptomyces cinnabarinus]